ncbi:MAG: acyl carrier protein [Anaerolineae bacterium]|nr:acyl carrier protein [Anaerolineae bacterium]
MMPAVKDQIRQFLAENFLFTDDASQLDDSVSLLEEGIVDSTGVLELVGFIEETYGLRVDDEEIVPDNFDSIQRLASFVRRKQAAAA